MGIANLLPAGNQGPELIGAWPFLKNEFIRPITQHSSRLSDSELVLLLKHLLFYSSGREKNSEALL